ncbi:MAG: dihydrofolate reductase family protein, partial [Acidimicrobiia bacterium]
WGDTTILRSTADVAAVKQSEGGAIFIHGSAELARRLADADLIDRYNLLVFPVLLGAGKSLFSRADRDKTQLNLRESESYSNGVTKLIYDVIH